MRRIIIAIIGLAMLFVLSGCVKSPQKESQPKEATETKVVWIAKDGTVSRSKQHNAGAVFP